jgi:hypothetical protein
VAEQTISYTVSEYVVRQIQKQADRQGAEQAISSTVSAYVVRTDTNRQTDSGQTWGRVDNKSPSVWIRRQNHVEHTI